MIRVPVTSSDLASVGYDPETVTLEVEFNKSGVYQYFGVPPHVHEELMMASSKGKYFNQFIRRGGYQYMKIG